MARTVPAGPTGPSDLDVRLDEPRTALVLALADDDLVMGHRALHWTGVAPSLEEDIAFSGIAQDEINHADVWYQLLAGSPASPSGPAATRAKVDALGLGRDHDQYRHAILCEREPHDFAFTLARHWLYDHADAVRLAALTGSSDPEIAAIATRLAHEERYHVQHAEAWFWRLVRAGGEPHRRLQEALRRAFPDALGLFEPTVGEPAAVDAAILPMPSSELLVRWLDVVEVMLQQAGCDDVLTPLRGSRGVDWLVPGHLFADPGGRRGVHTVEWQQAWAEMTALYRQHPGARW
ncbi:MAG TPA: 1,2-phenylacetyl-CoA epoxidase subunit PaaC [Nitriliruptorales bacterium]|nr:1,2-phenylacetyl-CoA epoxidase subunit PaaC [Nitriliruptorales bacterium]